MKEEFNPIAKIFNDAIKWESKSIKILERALYNLASAVNKESCYSCPIFMGGGKSCEDIMCKNCQNKKSGCFFDCKIKPKEDSDECIDKIVKFYVQQASKEIEEKKNGNKKIEQI